MHLQKPSTTTGWVTVPLLHYPCSSSTTVETKDNKCLVLSSSKSIEKIENCEFALLFWKAISCLLLVTFLLFHSFSTVVTSSSFLLNALTNHWCPDHFTTWTLWFFSCHWWWTLHLRLNQRFVTWTFLCLQFFSSSYFMFKEIFIIIANLYGTVAAFFLSFSSLSDFIFTTTAASSHALGWLVVQPKAIPSSAWLLPMK